MNEVGPDFRRLWWGHTISEFGSLLGAVSLLAVLVLEATPVQMGLLGMAGTAPALLLGLPAGVWLDRRRRKPILMLADLGRAATLLAMAVLAIAGQLTFGRLLPLYFLVGCGHVIFRIGQESIVPSLVPPPALVEANSKLGASSSVAESISPAAGGLLVDLISAPLAILVDGATFLLSALFVSRITRAEEVASAPAPSLGRSLWVGWRSVADQPILRGLFMFQLGRHFFGSFIGATYALWVLRELGLTATALGVIVGSGGVGAVAGALLVGRLSRRYHFGTFMLTTGLIHSALIALIPLAGGPVWLAGLVLIFAQIAGDLFQTFFEVSTLSLRQYLTPPATLSRTNATFQTATQSATMAGFLIGGLLAEALTIRAALWLAFAGILLAYGWLWPLRQVEQLA